MALYQIEDVSFTYPEAAAPVLKHIHVQIEKGDFMLIIGASGCGKTTLLHQLKMEVRPEGSQTGKISYEGEALEQLESFRSVSEIGIVFQDPEQQIVMPTVWQELNFAMENLGYEREDIQRRVAEIVHFFGMESWLHMPIQALSGGQKQMVNLASVLTLRPKVLLLDEPTAQLDPVASQTFLELIARIHEELSVTIVMSEHRLEQVVSFATKLMILQHGNVVHCDTVPSTLAFMARQEEGVFHPFLPSISKLFFAKEKEEKTLVGQALHGIEQVDNRRIASREAQQHSIPITVREGKTWFVSKWRERHAQKHREQDVVSNKTMLANKRGKGETATEKEVHGYVTTPPVMLEFKDVYFQYEKDIPFILQKASFHIRQGELFTLFGGNGCGKSTLLKTIAGMLKPQRGSIYWSGEALHRMKSRKRQEIIGYVGQQPLLYFTRETVEEQLMTRMQQLGYAGALHEIQDIIELFEMESFLKSHPYDISGGEQQKVVLALVLMANPSLLLLDEPTKGLDPKAKENLALLLIKLRARGKTIMMVSHDVEFTARYATTCALLFDGAITAMSDTTTFFSENFFFTTAMHRVVKEQLPTAITVEDVLAQWGT
ncbi:ABC transporter ATP-binding protein [Longirhabdus pacifica]|uniref:ABC transporter ATP-binding protein n=1 Tax=Longirhabdus pacifica TaxID=2305227 RepID=UPI0013E8C953|nr:ATP-binding cassette domain-containing protein [Longirhabdus pacifica]